MEDIRRQGRTTKIVDKCVDELFETGFVVIKDHYDTIQENLNCCYKVINRLKAEHNLQKRDFIIDYTKPSLQLKVPLLNTRLKITWENVYPGMKVNLDK
jgi:hypothetical protein